MEPVNVNQTYRFNHRNRDCRATIRRRAILTPFPTLTLKSRGFALMKPINSITETATVAGDTQVSNFVGKEQPPKARSPNEATTRTCAVECRLFHTKLLKGSFQVGLLASVRSPDPESREDFGTPLGKSKTPSISVHLLLQFTSLHTALTGSSFLVTEERL